jgi:hypothetical protein
MFWRNFAEINLCSADAETAVRDFVRRRGDPAGSFDRRAQAGEPLVAEPSGWIPFNASLRVMVWAWSPPDATTGISRLTDDSARVHAAVRATTFEGTRLRAS